MTPYQNEVLTILAEECAEVVQLKCKIDRFGIDSENPVNDTSNRDSLTYEVGDLLAMINLLVNSGLVEATAVYAAAEHKTEKVARWMKYSK